MSANIKRAQDLHQPCKTVRDFLAEFDGLARTQRRAAICDAVGASHLALDKFLGNATDLKRTSKLLDEMKRYSTPVAPKNLGAVGRAHLCAKLEEEGADPETIKYKMEAIVDNGIPYLIEAAFGYIPEDVERSIVTGVNWSVAIGDPFRKLGNRNESLGALLTDLKCDEEQPIVFALHVACPRIEYLDRGKSSISLPSHPRAVIVNLVTEITKKWTRQRRAEEHDATARLRRHDRMLGRREMSQKDAAALAPHLPSSVLLMHNLAVNARTHCFNCTPISTGSGALSTMFRELSVMWSPPSGISDTE